MSKTCSFIKAGAILGGTVIVTWYDGMRSRVSVGYIGENGLKANTAYRVNTSGAFVEAK